MPRNSKRGRMNEEIRRELIAIIGEMKDPRLSAGLLSVMRVEAAPDLSSAKVYISMMSEKENALNDAVGALRKAAGHVRSELGKRMHIRRSPELLFVADDGSAYAMHINEIIKGLEEE